jgi:hypothetical protein
MLFPTGDPQALPSTQKCNKKPMEKPGKQLSQGKSLRPFSLMSFILKTLEKLLDRYIRGGVLVEKPLHQNQFAYRAGMSTETALFQVVH